MLALAATVLVSAWGQGVRAAGQTILERFDDAGALSQRDPLGQQRQSGDIRLVDDPLRGTSPDAEPVYRFRAGPKRGKVGKAALILPFDTLRPGDRLEVRAQIMVPEDAPQSLLHLMDVECKYCGQKGNPGVRLHLRDGQLRVDRKKIGERRVWALDNATRLPAGRWVEVTWTLQLGLGGDPTLSLVRLGGQAVLRNRGRNLPDVPRPRAGVDRLQIGVTANSNDRPAVVYLRMLHLTFTRAQRLSQSR